MTTKNFLLFMMFSLWANSSGAVSPLCQAKSGLPKHCQTAPVQSSPLKNLEKIETHLWLISEAETTQDIYRLKKDQFANMFRLIDNGKLDDKKLEPKIKQEIDATIDDLQTLHHLALTIKSLTAKLQVCYTGRCGPTRRIELEDQLATVSKSKSYLLIKRPLLTHSAIENFIMDNEEAPTPETAKKLVSLASRETTAKLLAKIDSYALFLRNDQQEIPPGVADELLNRFEMSGAPPGKEKFLCSLAIKREKERERDALIKTGIETSLFVAPLLLGPWGRLSVFGLEGILGARLLRFGMSAKEIESAAWLTRASAGITANTYQSLEVKKIGESCKTLEQKFLLKADTKNFDELNACKTEYSDSVFLSTLGWMTAIVPEIPAPALKFYKAKFTPQIVEVSSSTSQIGSALQKTPLTKNQWAKDFATKDQGHFTYMDLSKLERVSDHQMRQVPDDYWKFVGNIYSERLNLTADEIKGFIKSSQEFAPRTKLIVNTNDAVKDAKTFNGGVGVVVTDKMQDLLPAEKAIGKNFERNPSEKVAEIVRLTVSKDADAEKLSKSLLSQAAAVIMQDPDIKTIYVYTSKVHGRLYKRFGVTNAQMAPQGDRDVIIKMSRTDLEKMLASARN